MRPDQDAVVRGAPVAPDGPDVRRPAKLAAGLLALFALAAGAFLLVGLLLPGTAEVTRSVEIEAEPDAVFALVGDLDAWVEWTPWGEVQSRVDGRSTGVGARRVWDDGGMGSGVLTLVGSTPPRGVEYLAVAAGGRIRFEGTIGIRANAATSTVVWTERADLGRNPLLGWTALTLEESQGGQIEASLARLKRIVEQGRGADSTAGPSRERSAPR